MNKTRLWTALLCGLTATAAGCELVDPKGSSNAVGPDGPAVYTPDRTEDDSASTPIAGSDSTPEPGQQAPDAVFEDDGTVVLEEDTPVLTEPDDSLQVDDSVGVPGGPVDQPEADSGKFHPVEQPIEQSYIAVISELHMREAGQTAREVADNLARDYGVEASWAGNAVGCVMFTGTEERARQLAEDSRVDSVTEDSLVEANEVQQEAIPGLDLLDGVVDENFTFNATGQGMTVFVLDTGISPHSEFGDRLLEGENFINDGRDASDCQGHGTHVASTAVGTLAGVAKGAQVVPMRVLGCNGRGSTNGIIRAINSAVQRTQQQGLRSIINMSLGGGVSFGLDRVVDRAMDANVFVAAAAGNENANACGGSPARSGAMTVCATTFEGRRAGFSNFGDCVDICAPGQGIAGASASDPNRFVRFSGTSMACPHVAGAAALAMEAFPDLDASEIKSLLISESRDGLRNLNGSPDRLLFVGFIDAPAPQDPPDDGNGNDPEPDPGDGDNGGDPDPGDGDAGAEPPPDPDNGGDVEEPVEDDPGRPRNASASGTVFRNQELRTGAIPILGGTRARIALSGNGDADLYVRFNRSPTVTRFNCRPFRNGSNEVCEGTVPQGAQTMHLMVRGFASRSEFRLDLEWVEP